MAFAQIGSGRRGVVRRRAARSVVVLTVAVAMFAGALTPAVPAPPASAASAASAAPAQAASGRWSQVSLLKGGTPIFAAGGAGSSFPSTKLIFDEWAALKPTVENGIEAVLAPRIDLAAREAANFKLKYAHVTIEDNMPLTVSFTADGNGKVTATATLPTVKVRAKLKRPDWDVRVWFTAHAGPAKVKIDYDLHTGEIGDAEILELPTRLTDVEGKGPGAISFLTTVLSVLSFASSGFDLSQVIEDLTIRRAITGFALSQAQNIADLIATWVAATVLADEIDGIKGELNKLVTGFSVQTPFGLDRYLNQIPADLTYQGTNVRRFIRDAINKNVKGHLVTVQIGKGSAFVGSPWLGGTHGGANVLRVKVAGYELQITDTGHPGEHHPLVMQVWQKCTLGLYPSHWCSQAKQSAQQLAQGLAVLQAEAAVQQEMAALAAYLQANPHLASSVGPVAYQLQQQLQYLQAQSSTARQQIAAARQFLSQGPQPTTTTTTRPPTTTTRPPTTTTRPPTTTTTTTQPQASAAQIRTRAQADLTQLSQTAQQLNQYLAALAAQAQANPAAASSIGAAAYGVQLQLQAVQAEMAVAQSCINNPSTAQCRQRYG